MSYTTVYSIVINQINANKGKNIWPYSHLFIYILINNLVGMVSYSFAPTSHFILTFSISFTIVIGATILGFQIYSLKKFFTRNGMKDFFFFFKKAKIVQLVRTLISCINNENSSFSLGLFIYNSCCLLSIVTIISFLLLTKIPK